MKSKKRIKPAKKTPEIVSKDHGSPGNELTEIALKAIEGVDPLLTWQYFSLRLMEANGWNEKDLKAEVDKLADVKPTRTGRSKTSNRQTRRGRR